MTLKKFGLMIVMAASCVVAIKVMSLVAGDTFANTGVSFLCGSVAYLSLKDIE